MIDQPFSVSQMDPTTAYVSAFQYGNSLHSVISAARLLKLRTATTAKEEKPQAISPFSPEARVPLPCELNEHNFSTSVWKRNERERYRVRCVNDGYERLRDHLPLNENDRRISKVDTLRLAIRYIRHLEAVLCNEDHWTKCNCFETFKTESEDNAERSRKNRGRKRQYDD
ncbi:Helix-loop-helix protein 6 [Toxocara canis]|uniref:Helix-loop-helix protein 6 n=1 Tax=Toxocara canis TaxID=6265 RepID=A0A0B2VBZ0_TOXCA|nr:Helix-loop-helix protein 6 [Toxocara canis]